MVTELLSAVTDPILLLPLIAAILIGFTAPVVGTFLVQRRLALLGDGIGHVALTGVALGWLIGALTSITPHDALAFPAAVIAAIVGAIAIELVRERGRTSGDVALAMLFYGGIAGGVLLIEFAGGSSDNLVKYLFGSVSTVTATDVWVTVALSGVILLVGLGLRTALFAVCHDEEFARASGLPVRALNIVLAVMAALTVTVAMRVVGVLMVSALMVVPVATAQLVASNFRRTMAVAMGVGVVVAALGLLVTYWVDISPGATIVVLAITTYAVVAIFRPVALALGRRRRRDAPVTEKVPAQTAAVRP